MQINLNIFVVVMALLCYGTFAAAPTKALTVVPTKTPSVDPTVSPTETPTADPTFSPTNDPTVNPTETPTADPTIPPPSASPTFRPTLNPAATRSPTARPTHQVSPVVSWYTNITLDGVAQPTLDEDSVKVLVRTVAELAMLPTNAVRLLRTGPATINIPARRLLGGIHDQTFHFTAHFYNSIALAATDFETPFALFNYSMHHLEDAVHHGEFDYRIQQYAETDGTPDLFDASSYQITNSDYTVTPPPGKDEDLSLTEGDVAIIVIICCLVVFFVFCYMAWDHIRVKHDKPQGVVHANSSAPQGNVAAEDENEETVVNKL